MKILLLNPHIDAEHKIAAALRAKGFAVLVAGHPDEGWQACQLHGTSLDLAVVHREWGKEKDGGIKFVEKLRTDPVQADLPFILTSEDWSEVECAIHQKSANGANAYLRWPFAKTALLDVIQKIFPDSLLPSDKAEQTLTSTQGPKVGDLNTVALAGAEPGISVEGATATGVSNVISLSQGLGVGMAPLGVPAGPPLMGPPGMAPVAPGEGSVPALEFTSPQMNAIPTAPHSPMGDGSSAQIEAGTGLVLEDVSSLIRKPDVGSSPGVAIPGGIALEAPAPPALDQTSPSTPDLSQSTRALPSQGTHGLDAPLGTATVALTGGTSPIGTEELNVGPVLDLSSAAMTKPISPAQQEPSLQIAAPLPPRPQSFQQKPPARGEGTNDLGSIVASGNPPTDEPVYDLRADKEVATQMPYLFGKTGGVGQSKQQASPIPALLGDAIIPGGAGKSADVETLKKYLTLREHDVAVLSARLRAMQDKIDALEDSIQVEKAQSAELLVAARTQKQKLEELERAKGAGNQQLLSELDDVRFRLKVQTDQNKILEARAQEEQDEIEKLKERVRSDIRKIRVHERELENRLEILKRDSEALIGARESKIIELKRKLDILEFNMDLLQNQFSREKDTSARLRDRLAKAGQIVRVAGGLLDAEGKAALAKITGPTEEDIAALVAPKGKQAS